jgi:outer membrane protein assembly factor BamB
MILERKVLRFFLLFIFSILFILKGNPGIASDQPQWGEKYSRNMVSSEKNLPASFDPVSGKNVKWKVPLGSQSYSTPVVCGGKIFIGTNNDFPRDGRHQGDRGVLLCLNESTGNLLWQLVVPKLNRDPYWDWPKEGIVSPATVEGNRIYIVSNRGEVICIDIDGQINGNDGVYTAEGQHMALEDSEPMEVTPMDADIIWLFDMIANLGIRQHDAAHCSILLEGEFLYVNTSNGVDNTHRQICSPQAPSLIVLNKSSGRIVAKDNERIGPRIFHSTWSSPAYAIVNGQKQIFFGGGDGICYGFQAVETVPKNGKILDLKKIWWYDGDPLAPKENVHQYIKNRQISPSNIKSMPVFHENRIYLTLGGDIWWGKREAWLKCIEATQTGDISDSGEIWSYPLEQHVCSTPAIYKNMVFITDLGKNIYCIDKNTGRNFWTQETNGEFWASPLVADGKLFAANRRGEFYVFEASPAKKMLSYLKLDSPISATPVAANSVLYIATDRFLYAIENAAK